MYSTLCTSHIRPVSFEAVRYYKRQIYCFTLQLTKKHIIIQLYSDKFLNKYRLTVFTANDFLGQVAELECSRVPTQPGMADALQDTLKYLQRFANCISHSIYMNAHELS